MFGVLSRGRVVKSKNEKELWKGRGRGGVFGVEVGVQILAVSGRGEGVDGYNGTSLI